MAKGYFALVLHGHLPFVRHPEHEDSFEETWLYQAITEVYVPLLLMLDRLVEDAIDFRVTFSLTPTLVSMLSDPFLQSRYLQRLERLIELTRQEIIRNRQRPGLLALSAMYQTKFERVRDVFTKRYKGNLVQAFARLQKLGKMEIIASAATHGYLPLLAVNPPAARAQVAIGISHYAATFGQSPAGFWLPECGYYPGVDQVLSDHGIRFTILETHGITRAKPRPRYGVHAPLTCPAGVAVFGRDPESSKQVWSSVDGYPGDFDYREFYRDVAYDLDADSLRRYVHRDALRIDTGIKYYRVTGKTEDKQVYIPEAAANKAQLHANHFVAGRERQCDYLASVMDRTPIIVAPYDAELFGHWWYEGPLFLEHVIRALATDKSPIQMVTLSEYLEKYPGLQPAEPPLSSWGRNGFNEVWLGPETHWIYPHLRHAATVMNRLEMNRLETDRVETIRVETGPSRGNPLIARALHQAKREVLLAQASDWAFMIGSHTTLEYATRRIEAHLINFNRISEQISKGVIEEEWLAELEAHDCIFSTEVLSKASPLLPCL